MLLGLCCCGLSCGRQSEPPSQLGIDNDHAATTSEAPATSVVVLNDPAEEPSTQPTAEVNHEAAEPPAELDRLWREAQTASAKEILNHKTRLFGDEHWQTVDAKLNLESFERLAKLSEDEWRRFLSADALSVQAAEMQRAGKNKAALDKLETALPIYTTLLGLDNQVRLRCLSNEIICCLELGDYFKAQPLVKDLIERQPKLKGTLHPDTVLSLRLLARFNEAVGDLASAEDGYRKIVEIQTALAGPAHPETIAAWVDVARICVDRDKLTDAVKILVEALPAQRELLGEENLATAQTMKVLGNAYCKQRSFADADPLLTKSIDITRKIAGERHLATASAYNARGRLRIETGQWKEADSDLKQSLSICTETLGENHPIMLKVLDNWARIHETGVNSGVARQIRMHCLRIAEQSFGEVNLQTADALENLAITSITMNDFGLAEPYLLRARAIRSKLLGDEHPLTAIIVGRLGYVYLGVSEPERAEPLLRKALAVLDKSSPKEAVKFQRWLALLLQSQGKLEEAEREYRRALESVKLLERPDNLAAADVKLGLAQNILMQGRCPEARQLMDDVLDAYGRSLHPDDPQWLDALGIAGTVSLAAGEVKQAEQLLARGLRVAQLRMQSTGGFQSERQQLAQLMIMRDMFDLYLSLPFDAATIAQTIYPHVLSWKGAVAARQWHDRQNVTDETAPIATELQQISRQLATLSIQIPDAADRQEWIHRIFQLNMRKEALEEQRAVLISNLGNRTIGGSVAIAELQRAIPPETVLIDFLQYVHTSFENENGVQQMSRQHRYMAFLVRRDRPVELVGLGDVAPIAEAVTKLRQTRGFRPNAGKDDWAATLGNFVWSPLRPHVEGCRTILISPDGALSRLAWNLLPGREPGRYLIEDVAVALVPVPQLLPAMLDANRRPTSRIVSHGDSLLLVGDVDYNASGVRTADGVTAPSGHEGGLHFNPLKGTSAEVQALRALFQRRFPGADVTVLDRAKATEEAFWLEAPRHRWLHIATHGFFAPSDIKTALATQTRMDPDAQEHSQVSVFQVGFLNGLALAGANNRATGDAADGILTAAEIATMDLRSVDVAVLSGCETGLGEVHSGEGTFGMQRALQIAGVGATVASLWTVSDEKTNLLMQRFYANLWDKKLTRLDALREAQIWMLNTGGVQTTATASQSPGKRFSPHYWAAFALSGDWR